MNVLEWIADQSELPMWAVWIFTFITAAFGAGRLTRVVVYDDFPPTIWLRVQWDKLTDESSWNKLLHCYWCFGFWAGAFCVGWFGLGLLVDWIMIAWFIVFGLLTLGYIISMIVNRDEQAE